jgi:hypothetical protein
MKFFRERNGVWRAPLTLKPGSFAGTTGVSLLLVPGVLLAVMFMVCSDGVSNAHLVIAFIAAAIVASFAAILLRVAGAGTAIAVDKTGGSVTFKPPGRQRRRLPLKEVNRILVMLVGGFTSFLILEDNSGRKHVLIIARDTDKLRLFAGELSALTAVPVTEEATTADSVTLEGCIRNREGG